MFLAASLLTPSTAATEPYILLTPAEAMAWWAAITPEEQAAFIIRYDAVEHAVPVLEAPRYVAVIAGRDLHLVAPQLGVLTVGALNYQVTYAPLDYPDLLPAPVKAAWVLPAAVGVVVGAAAVGIPWLVTWLAAMLHPN